jgi:excisionase family DNA binding protein
MDDEEQGRLKDFLSLSKAARKYHIGAKVLSAAVRNGELPAYRLGERTIRVEPSAVEAWIRSRRVPTWRTDHVQKRA